ncbi:Niemann-Pick C1 protein-like [Senna tora]|uniref:Niemann-Pick C1 protein-like n=1 Tax=Senna tora TaxID=362788 RepID=A0A834SUE0_9FABA|nr:Niemann-Pick C1 protein-like [Senna tora]
MQPKKRVNWALQDTTQKNGTKMVNEPSVEELGQVKAQSSLEKGVSGCEGVRNESIRPLALTWVAKGVDKAKKATEGTCSGLGAALGEGNAYNSSTHASLKEKWVTQEVNLGPLLWYKGGDDKPCFLRHRALIFRYLRYRTVDDDSLISHFENEEGLLIEQLEKEYVEEQKQQKKEVEVPLDGFALLFGGVGEEATYGFLFSSLPNFNIVEQYPNHTHLNELCKESSEVEATGKILDRSVNDSAKVQLDLHVSAGKELSLVQGYLSSFYKTYGRWAARNPAIVLCSSLAVVLLLCLGLFCFRVETQPEKVSRL